MADIKILDGGFSAQLSTHVGAKIDGDPLWTSRFLATNPDVVFATHLDFLRAGADVIETNTYQASIPGLMKHLNITQEESLNLLHEAVNLAKKAVDTFTKEISEKDNVKNRKPMIAGSCGPYGACLNDASEYSGSYGNSTSSQIIMDWHRPRIQALLDAGVDLLALETIPCHQEAEALVKLLKEFPKAKVWMSFSCRANSQSMVDGSNFQEIAMRCYRDALPGQIVAIGVNCLAPKDVTPLLKGINKSSMVDFIPLIVYPNSGERYSQTEGWVKENVDRSFESFIPEWIELGVRYLGGCCRMYAANVSSIRTTVEQYQEQRKAK
ncbi:hypothetical protein KM043_005337 [Ampulex compressa]|nr:hypothetical protein KM043_005337 [Ampulex compressa]